jgi:hypothetical protein
MTDPGFKSGNRETRTGAGRISGDRFLQEFRSPIRGTGSFVGRTVFVRAKNEGHVEEARCVDNQMQVSPEDH